MPNPDLPTPGMPSLLQQLAVMPPLVKAGVGVLLISMGSVAVILMPESLYSWVLVVLGGLVGMPLGWQGVAQSRQEKLEAEELDRAGIELESLRVQLEQVAEDKRGVERFLMECGYTTTKARRWIALECGVVLPISRQF